MMDSNDPNGNQTCDLPPSGTVPQPTVPPHPPYKTSMCKVLCRGLHAPGVLP